MIEKEPLQLMVHEWHRRNEHSNPAPKEFLTQPLSVAFSTCCPVPENSVSFLSSLLLCFLVLQDQLTRYDPSKGLFVVDLVFIVNRL
ncbi:Uncharacterized protein HZ326_25867 [Fusarium oxysporum f. sp. albedinis]|nr:Uncharacterized protein HZ326_25867 [Fusarium oxysporum f. sp. albedinis]